MPVERVDSADDPRVALFRDLPASNLTRPSGLFIAEGWLVVERLLASGRPIQSVLLDEKFRDELLPRFSTETTIYEVPHALVSQIVGFKFHRGVLACGRRGTEPTLEAYARGWDEAPSRPRTVVIAADVNDPENMGCILRNSAAFGVDLVLVNRRCADPFSRRVLRTSMGTIFRLPLVSSDDLHQDAQRLQEKLGFEVAATVLSPDAEPLYEARRSTRWALLFGNEGHGLPAELANVCRRRVTLPMRGGTDSLNVGVASGIFLYHYTSPAAVAAAERAR